MTRCLFLVVPALLFSSCILLPKEHLEAPDDIREVAEAQMVDVRDCLRGGLPTIPDMGIRLGIGYRPGEGTSQSYGWWWTYQGVRVCGLAFYNHTYVRILLATDPAMRPRTWNLLALRHELCHYWLFSTLGDVSGHPDEGKLEDCCPGWGGTTYRTWVGDTQVRILLPDGPRPSIDMRAVAEQAVRDYAGVPVVDVVTPLQNDGGRP